LTSSTQKTKARSTPEGIKVYPTTVTDFRKITAYLDNQKYEYLSHVPATTRQIRQIIENRNERYSAFNPDRRDTKRPAGTRI
jgi:hypothetical protein